MPVETVKIYREVELHADSAGAATFAWLTEMPGSNMLVRHTASFNTDATTPGETAINIRFKGEVKGKLAAYRLTGTAKLYALRVRFRYLGDNTPWQWGNWPIEQTAAVYQDFALPMPGVSKAREWVNLAVDEI